MTKNLTEKETAMLIAFVTEGIRCSGFDGMAAEDLIEDNTTWMNANDLKDDLGWSKLSIGGVMSSLSEKGLIFDTYDSPRKARVNDWVASPDGIRWYFDLFGHEATNKIITEG